MAWSILRVRARNVQWVRPVTVAVSVAGLLLLLGTAAVFRAFDLHSHSASDTLRPFVLTMAPVWIVGIAAARVLLRRAP